MTQDPRARLETLLDEIQRAMQIYREVSEQANEAKLDWELARARLLPRLEGRSVEERAAQALELHNDKYKRYRTTEIQEELAKEYLKVIHASLSATQSLLRQDVESDRATAFASRP